MLRPVFMTCLSVRPSIRPEGLHQVLDQTDLPRLRKSISNVMGADGSTKQPTYWPTDQPKSVL